MNILLIGSGGREHALATKITQSKHCTSLYTAPGNPGTAELGHNISLDITDDEVLFSFIRENEIEIVVVGPEAPLVDGIYDRIKSEFPSVIVVGPSAKGAVLEGSKAAAKEFMMRHNIPTAAYFECNEQNLEEANSFLEELQPPYVLKADGLAAGKGVLILDDLDEAKSELEAMLSGKFGEASKKIVIEEFLDGIEYSVFALTDGKDYVLLPEAKDYKRIGEGDTGLNTGGMGAVSPVPFVDETLWSKTIQEVVKPTIDGLHNDDIDYKGFVFFGLINVGGSPKVIEYNCRMGDPETEVVLPRLQSDLVEAFIAMDSGNLSEYIVEVDERSAATVMLVSGGYPEAYEKGKEITHVGSIENGILFHAGTKLEGEKLLTNGGRVMAITSFGDNHNDALANSLGYADKIDFEGKNYRKDIGFDL